jgi:hypothetical protein
MPQQGDAHQRAHRRAGGQKRQDPALSTQHSAARTCGAMWRACTDVTVKTPSL